MSFNFSLFQIIKVLLQSFDYALEKAEEGKTEARRGGKGLLLTLWDPQVPFTQGRDLSFLCQGFERIYRA